MVTANIYSLFVKQTPNSLLPFSFDVEVADTASNVSGDVLSFEIMASDDPSVDYEAILKRDNSAINEIPGILASNVYTPQPEEAYYKHDAYLYVDVISNDDNGMREIRTHVEPNAYEFKEPELVYVMPKFTWVNGGFSSSSTTTTTTPIGFTSAFWCGSSDGFLSKVDFNTSDAQIRHQFGSGQNINRIIRKPNSNQIYVSLKDDLRIYTSDQFVNCDEASEYFSLGNNDDSRLMTYFDDYVWATESYSGKIVKMDPTNLSLIEEFSGFDSPSKIVWSEQHDAYLVSGGHVLWKMTEAGEKTAVYQVNDYWIEDFDVSEWGYVCLLLRSSTSNVIRILKKNFYTFEVNMELGEDHRLRYCKYCYEGRFYVLDELEIEDTTYSADNYVFDVRSGTTSKVRISEGLTTTTTTSTLPGTSDAIEVESPDGGETLVNGETYDILWSSSKASTDLVKIELYRGGYPETVIEESIANIGSYNWTVPDDVVEAVDYKIRITWISSTPEYGESTNDFTISPVEPVTTTTTTTKPYSQYSIGIAYDADNDQIVNVLRSGLFAVFPLSGAEIYGLIESGLSELRCMAVGDDTIGIFGVQTKVRLFVGSQEHWSDKWDSGEVDTRLTSMYYGGGNNLEPGSTYYAHLQVYSEETGWSEVAIQEFTMPK